MFVAGLLGVITVVVVPQVSSSVNRSHGYAAVRYLASRMALARAQAVSRSANVALRFDSDAAGIRFAVFTDGNGDGVRNADIAAGTDPMLEPWVLLSGLFPGVRIAVGDEVESGEAVQVGTSRLLVFTALGTATSGSVYVLGRDGTQWVIRVLGTTGRTRILRYSTAGAEWLQTP